MDDWHESLWKMIDSVLTETHHLGQAISDSTEHFVQEVGDTIEQAADEMLAVIESAADELQQVAIAELEFIATELEQTFTDINPLNVETHFNSSTFDISVWVQDLDESEFELNPKVQPSPYHHPACMGCQHYHGRRYQGRLLVCAMHPYGWNEAHCPDWEAKKTPDVGDRFT